VDLARALEPLYRNYLRRLDEMAARVGGGVLREPVMRDGHGRILLGEGGLPRRFDVASSATGETFEVHGARADDPAARELTFGGVAVRIAPGNWEEFPVACAFASAAGGSPQISDDDAAAFADVLRSWAALAAAGGFASQRDPDRWSGRLHGIAVSLSGPRIVAVCDLGTCPPESLESLLAAIAAFGRERRSVVRVEMGGPAES
jgi:hypothetical protein